MANQYLFLAKKVLEQADKPLTFNDVWKYAVDNGIDKEINPKGKTPWNSLGAQLFVDVRDNEKSDFIKIGKRPARFFLKERKNEVKEDAIIKTDYTYEEKSVKLSFSERDLHPILTYFVYMNLTFNKGKRILTKTIYHEKSKKSGYSEWVYPDLVGFYIPIEDWETNIIALNRISDNNFLKLFSFEVKKKINRANYRESFFQAVSNSSWAHEGYLVTSDLYDDEDLLAELERLNQSFGIGLIELDLDDIDSSKIVFPSKPKPSLDWETMNKLADSNDDFSKFIREIISDLEGKKIHKSEYDKIIDDIDKYIKQIMK